jgi:hypothetical protein
VSLQNTFDGQIKMRLPWVEHLEAPEQFLVRDIGFARHADKQMEVVGHDGVGEDVDAAEVCDLPELFAEDLLGGVVEVSLAIDGAGDAVVDGR